MEVQNQDKYPSQVWPLSPTMRAIAFLPLSFFLFRLWVAYQNDEPEIVLWLCHLNNLLLFIGILFSSSKIIQITAIWLIVGFILWVIDLSGSGTFIFSSFVSHFGGLLVSVYFLVKTKMNRSIWIYSIIWFILVQQFCRLYTSPQLNINSGNEIWSSYKGKFEYYGEFWIFQIISLSLILGFTNIVMFWLINKLQLKRQLC
jgi:hypothetical protein